MAVPEYWNLIAPAWAEYRSGEQPEEFLVKLSRFPPEVGHLLAANWCQYEVCNGGFYQFFSNSLGFLAPEALEGFRAMGLTDWASVLEQAMAFFPEPFPRVHYDREDYLREHVDRDSYSSREEWDPFYRLDASFHRWLRGEPNRWERAANLYASQMKKS